MVLTLTSAMNNNLMKFMAGQPTAWPMTQTSKKTNVTALDDPAKGKLIFQYYVKRLWKNDTAGCTEKEKFQFHGNCYFWGVGIKDV